MAGKNSNKNNNIFSENDALDINDLASLNDDISPEFIEQLQSRLEQNLNGFSNIDTPQSSEDGDLFEEIPSSEENTKEEEIQNETKSTINEDIDDNFMKKYKAKLNKEKFGNIEEDNVEIKTNKNSTAPDDAKTETKETAKDQIQITEPDNNEIESLTSGNIIEKPIDQTQLDYNESLDFLDDNIKYSKYVIYINPENKEFMDSLTVKERKNLINRIIREQDDIAITKRRLGLVQTIIKHSIIAIVTVAIAIPVIYWTINTSLEASIDNYRRSQTVFKTLYREKGKIQKTKPH